MVLNCIDDDGVVDVDDNDDNDDDDNDDGDDDDDNERLFPGRNRWLSL